ncbi:hypothetical protein [Acinetobacter sp. ANC 4648]|uniref:hypothetical protein n=1 Tax=Acinetobacter sp. ANC 4648 TaxID=1977875 RepID=UPI000A33FBE2|nr:hypothetical protein [Acinetobacter sp. ANC 4648]OTG81744.1 hypothetical protein B9T27_10805 [Acinetobacter sp. ANC 4648]
MRKIFPLILLLAVGNWAHAEISDYLPEAKLKSEDAAMFNIGAGMTMKLVHVNGEWVNPYGIAYVKLGAFTNDDHEFGGQLGFRYPTFLNGTDKNGFYVGAYAGQIKSKSTGKTGDKTQLGVGADLAYVLLNKERISTFSIGMGAGNKVTSGNTIVFEARPEFQASYSLSFGF